jgi:hypothetical protein
MTDTKPLISEELLHKIEEAARAQSTRFMGRLKTWKELAISPSGISISFNYGLVLALTRYLSEVERRERIPA